MLTRMMIMIQMTIVLIRMIMMIIINIVWSSANMRTTLATLIAAITFKEQTVFVLFSPQ